MFLFDSKKIGKAIFSEILNSKEKDINLKINNILSFIKKHKLEKNIKHIIKYIDLEYNKYKKENIVHIESPIKLDKKEIEYILSKLKIENNKEFLISENKKIIGGFIAVFKNKIYDASILNNLEKLKRSIKS